MYKGFRMSFVLLTALVAISISSISGSAIGGNILISSTPSGAVIYLDGIYNPSLTTPFIINQVSPGLHTIKLVHTQYDDWTTTVNVVEGSTTNVSATLIKTLISISSTPSGAGIFFDGNTYLGETPLIKLVLPGLHTIRLVHSQYDDWTTTVDVVEGNTTMVSPTLSIKSSTQNPAPTMITSIITSPSVTPAPTYTTTQSPMATYSPKQTQTPLPIYSGSSTPTNTQTTETSNSKTDPSNSPDWTQVIMALAAVVTIFITIYFKYHEIKKEKKH